MLDDFRVAADMADDYSRSELVAIGGGVLTILGAFLPWVKLGMLGSQNGLDANGTYTLVLGVAVLAVVVLRNWEQTDAGIVAVLGLVTLGLGAWYITDPAAAIGMEPTSSFGKAIAESLSPGVGLFVTAFGGLATTIGGGLGYRDAA